MGGGGKIPAEKDDLGNLHGVSDTYEGLWRTGIVLIAGERWGDEFPTGRRNGMSQGVRWAAGRPRPSFLSPSPV